MSTINITFTIDASAVDLDWLLKQLRNPNSPYRVATLEKIAADLEYQIDKRLYHPQAKRPDVIKLQPKIAP